MAGGNEKEKTAYHLVGEYLKSKNKNARVFIVHRLDKETSGVLLFAKNEIIKNKLQNNWNDIVYKRGYLAIIEGKLKKKHGMLYSRRLIFLEKCTVRQFRLFGHIAQKSRYFWFSNSGGLM